jgi:hypothetical protein
LGALLPNWRLLFQSEGGDLPPDGKKVVEGCVELPLLRNFLAWGEVDSSRRDFQVVARGVEGPSHDFKVDKTGLEGWCDDSKVVEGGVEIPFSDFEVDMRGVEGWPRDFQVEARGERGW